MSDHAALFLSTIEEPSPLIVAAINAGNLPEAERLCRAQLLTQPDDENLLVLLAISLQFQQRLHEATAIHRRLTELLPDNSVHWCNYASALQAGGSTTEAESAFARSIELDPENVAPKIQMGLLWIQEKEYLRARDVLLDAFELDRESPMVRIHAAQACCLSQDFNGAESLLKAWRHWLPLNDDVLQLELAKLLQLMSDVPAAEALLEDLAVRSPSYMEARLLLAQIYERKNQLDRAETALQAIVSTASVDAAALANEVAHLRASLRLRRGDPSSALELLEASGPRHPGDYTHYFELAQARDKCADAAGTMHALAVAHRLQVEELEHASPEFFLPVAKAMPAEVVRVSAERYRQWPALIAPDAADSPVFIVGFPRSGTTLLEQMLDAHPKLQSMDENPFFNRLAEKLRRHDARILDNLDVLRQLDCDELRKQYLIMVSERINRHWDAQLVDKNPLNMLWVPMICRLFPSAKFILAVRHPCDVILSCYMQNFRSSILGAACSNLERLASAYVQSMEYWIEDAEIFQPNLLVSRYEDLVADVEGHSRRIASFLGLEDPAPLLTFHQHARSKGYIGTPSYTQVIEPVNQRGLDRWKKYPREFETVLPILEPMLRHWGYTADVAS
ncbi:MAG: sulfotransferase [Rhodanobacter sp.]